MRAQIEPLTPHTGAVVHVDRAHLCDDAVVQACLTALEERGVLVFPQLGLNDDEQLAFTDKLGPRTNPTAFLAGGRNAAADVYKVTFDEGALTRAEYVYGTFFWHIDGAMVPAPLSKATLLSARRTSQRGGQTEFANLYAAYEALPAQEKAELAELRAIHSLSASMRNYVDGATPEGMSQYADRVRVERPIVWTHNSGRKSLFVGNHADRVVGMPFPEGRAVLLRLLEWAALPEFRYTHQWQEGDLVVWDNCGVMHRVLPYDAKSGRVMHRTSIAGAEMAV